MKENLLKNNWLGIILLTFLVVLSLTFTNLNVLAYGEAEGEADPVAERQEEDKTQTEKEAEELEKLQKDDQKKCEAEAGGGGGGQQNGPGRPSNDDAVQNPAPGEPGTYGEPVGDEQTNRDTLTARGVEVNKQPCNGRPYQQVSGGCTDVAGLPQHSLDRLAELNQQTGRGLVITGGTEGGHSSHAPGNNVVDLRPSTNLNNYVAENTVRTWSGGSLGTYHELNNGDVFLQEQWGTDNAHWHARLSGTTGTTQTALKNINKFLSQKSKSLKEFLTQNILIQHVLAVNTKASSVVTLGNINVDLNNVGTEELSQLINNLSVSDINSSFSAMSSGNLQQITALMPFDSLNNVFSQLSPTSLNQIIPALGSGGFEDIASSLAYESIDNILGNLDAGPLNGLLGNLDSNALNTLLGSVYDGNILDGIMGNLSSNVLNNVIGQLGDGAINNIFGNLSEGVLNQVLGGLGGGSLDAIFTQLSGSTLNQVLGGLTGGLSETIFSVLGDGAIGNILNNGLASVVDSVMGGLSEGLLGDIFTNLSLDGLLGNFTGVLENLPVVGDILEGIPALSGIPGIGLLTGGLYVPVVEQNGQLMTAAQNTDQNTKNIDETTKEIKDLSVQICTHLKAIRRIQSRFELKTAQDADVARIKATEIEKYRQATFGDNGTIKTGYATLDEDGEQTEEGKGLPLFVMDNQTYIQNASDEGAKVALDKILQNNNSNNMAILAGLQAEDGLGGSGPSTEDIQNVLGITDEGGAIISKGPLDNIPILSTLLRPLRNTFAWLTGNSAWAAPGDPPANQQIDSDQFWNSFINVVRTNPGISYLRAQGDIEQSRNAAILAARDTAAQGQGFLPVRNCLAKTSDGKTCAVWGIVQPGIIVKETDAAAINARLDQYIAADSMAEIGKGNEPNVAEIMENKPSTGGGGAVGPGMVKPSGIPGQSADLRSDANTNNPGDGSGDSTGGGGTNGGGDLEGNNWDNLTISISGLFGDDDNANPDADPDIQDLLDAIQSIFGNLDNFKPGLIFQAKPKGDNVSLVYWYSPNADTCITTNDWLNGDGSAIADKGTGASLTKKGSVRVTIASGQSATYEIKCTNDNGSTPPRELTVSRK